MALTERAASGAAYLSLVTDLLHRWRRADPTGGVWEAADLQWWWRKDQHPNPAAQTFWLVDGEPIAAVILTDWGRNWGCDVICAYELFMSRNGDEAMDDAHAVDDLNDIVWLRAIAMIDEICDRPVEMAIRDDDATSIARATAAGFEPGDEQAVTTWMEAANRPAVASLPDGFECSSRAERPSAPHPMIRRNGEQVAERLAECSLYRPDLDLAVHTPDGDVAGYALFWADPVTRVGLVEPVRTEDAFQGRGVARHLLTAGVARLADAGCERCKVTYFEGNEPARRLYLGAGFRPAETTRTYVRGT